MRSEARAATDPVIAATEAFNERLILTVTTDEEEEEEYPEIVKRSDVMSNALDTRCTGNFLPSEIEALAEVVADDPRARDYFSARMNRKDEA